MSEPSYWLTSAIFLSVVAFAVLVACWWIHGERGPRTLTREIGGWLLILGGVRAWWDLAQGTSLLLLGALLWWRAGRINRPRPLDDTAVMGRSAVGADDDDDDG